MANAQRQRMDPCLSEWLFREWVGGWNIHNGLGALWGLSDEAVEREIRKHSLEYGWDVLGDGMWWVGKRRAK